jgi:hypothetical protein
MRRTRLILVIPLLGAGLAMGAVEVPQASALPDDTTGAGVPHTAAAASALVPASDYTKGYRAGHRDGFADGRKACKRRSFQRFSGATSKYDQGYAAGYDSGFAAGCKHARHGRPHGHHGRHRGHHRSHH